MAKEMIGAYAEPELIREVERECLLDYNRPKSQMMIILIREALDARADKRGKKVRA